MNAEETLIKLMVLNAVAKCSECGHVYHLEDVNVLGRQEQLWFLMMSCEECHSQGLVAAVLKEREDDEAVECETAKPAAAPLQELPDFGRVTSDDVLDMHQFLRRFVGDFQQLFDEQA